MLRELQREFSAALYGEPSLIERAIRDAPPGMADRLGIYRNNLRANFAATLELEFPVVALLCGADFFAELARDFQDAHPSRSGDLQRIGAPFADYLRKRFGTTEYAYFADVAALEWAREEAVTAPEAPPLALDMLQAVPADDIDQWRATLHPSVRLVESPWPILTIWRAHQSAPDIPAVDLGVGGERVLVWRSGGAQLAALAAAEHSWLRAIDARASFGEALDDALADDASFDLTAALQAAVTRGVLAQLGPAR
jgi:hypothetical protein